MLHENILHRNMIKYISELLDEKLPPKMYYHNINHTIDVYNHAMSYGRMEGLSKRGRDLLGIAALFHDLGYLYKYDKNESEGAKIAMTYFKNKNALTKKEMGLVLRLILATQMPQKPHTLSEEIICDSDLDSLGRKDFLNRGTLLRKELEVQKGIFYTDEEWNEIQLAFLSNHKYFTASAKKLRNNGQKKNLARLKKLLYNKNKE